MLLLGFVYENEKVQIFYEYYFGKDEQKGKHYLSVINIFIQIAFYILMF